MNKTAIVSVQLVAFVILLCMGLVFVVMAVSASSGKAGARPASMVRLDANGKQVYSTPTADIPVERSGKNTDALEGEFYGPGIPLPYPPPVIPPATEPVPYLPPTTPDPDPTETAIYTPLPTKTPSPTVALPTPAPFTP